MFLRNVGIHLQEYTVSQHKRPSCEPLQYCDFRSTNILIIFWIRETLLLFRSSAVTPCGNGRYCRRFEGTCCLHLQGLIATLMEGISYSRLSLKFTVVWYMKLWGHVDHYRRFGRTLCLHLQRVILRYRPHYSNLRDKINLNKLNYKGMPFLSPSA
jgi:hypothetical protein